MDLLDGATVTTVGVIFTGEMMIERDPTKDKCSHCEERRKESYMFCDVCNNPLWEPINISFSGDTQTSGYAGYNEGLGVTIENKGHYDQVLKEKGLRRMD